MSEAVLVLGALALGAVAALGFAWAALRAGQGPVLAVLLTAALLSLGFTNCAHVNPPPPKPPNQADCQAACDHLAALGCGSGDCEWLCGQVKLPGYSECVVGAETCLQADACDTGR